MAHLTEGEKLMYTRFFLQVDAQHGNGDGALDLKEFDKLMTICGHKMSKAELANAFCEIDTDRNWKITLDEFLAILPKSDSRESKAARLRRIFTSYDLNKDGFVTRDEMEKVLKSAGWNPEELCLNELIKECDKDGDGRLNFEEFINVIV